MHQVIYQISIPRSGSTAGLRCFETQDMFSIFHEPSIKPYELKKRWGLTRFMFRSDNKIDTFEQAEATILEAAKHSPVYVKDIVHSSAEWISRSSLLNNPNVHFVFLVRNPYDQLVSLCKQFNAMGVPTKMVSNVYDYDLLADLINVCRKRAPNRTLVMETECLCQYPEKIIKIIADQVGLDIQNVQLSWNPKPANFIGTEWHESKQPEAFRNWHHDAITSTCFRSLPTYPQNYSQFDDPYWAREVVAKNNAAYKRIFACAK